MLPIGSLHAIDRVLLFNRNQLRLLLWRNLTVPRQPAQLSATIDQGTRLLINCKANLHAGCFSIRAQQGITEYRAGNDLFPRRCQVCFWIQQCQIVFRDSSERRVAEYWHIENAVHRLDPLYAQQVLAQTRQDFQLGWIEQISVRGIGYGYRIAGAVAIIDLPGKLQIWIIFQQQGISGGIQTKVLSMPCEKGHNDQQSCDHESGLFEHYVAVKLGYGRRHFNCALLKLGCDYTRFHSSYR